nr:b3 domain-containing protein [Quercus suber]
MNTAVPVPKRARFRDQQHLEPPPNLPQKFKDVIKEMGGSDELLVIQKKLFMCDTNMNKNRFSIPFGQILSKDFLTEEEKKKLIEGQKIKAPLIDPELQSHDIFLVQRNNPDVYVLRNTWNNVHTSNDLKKDDVVQLWSFWARQQACDDASSSVNTECVSFHMVMKAGVSSKFANL